MVVEKTKTNCVIGEQSYITILAPDFSCMDSAGDSSEFMDQSQWTKKMKNNGMILGKRDL